MNSHRLSEVNAFATEISKGRVIITPACSKSPRRMVKSSRLRSCRLAPVLFNHLSPEDLAAAGSQIILGGNTYHMLVNPGMEVIRAGGGMHRFMGWDGPMLTDSG